MGTKKMLKQGLAGEKQELLNEVNSNSSKDKQEQPSKKASTPKGKDVQSVKETTSSENNAKSEKEVSAPKHPGGRPTHSSLGRSKRTQHTLTLTPEFYKEVQEAAYSKGLTFSTICELALREYLDNNR